MNVNEIFMAIGEQRPLMFNFMAAAAFTIGCIQIESRTDQADNALHNSKVILKSDFLSVVRDLTCPPLTVCFHYIKRLHVLSTLMSVPVEHDELLRRRPPRSIGDRNQSTVF